MAQPRITSNAPSQNIIEAVQFAMPAGTDVWHTSSESPLRLTYRFNSAQPGDLS